jgi:hypothetical protein
MTRTPSASSNTSASSATTPATTPTHKPAPTSYFVSPQSVAEEAGLMFGMQPLALEKPAPDEMEMQGELKLHAHTKRLLLHD